MEKTQLKQIYRLLESARQFEEKAAELFMDGEIPGFLHSSIGQEASAVGICMNLGKDDYISTTHRGHSHVIAKGADLKRMMAELYGKAAGYCRGKSGSMHIMDRELGVLGANGIVGAGIPIATGAALSAKIRGSDQVAVAFFGDGASNEGAFHESLNMAAVWKLPIVFACENNMYAESTQQSYHQGIPDVAVRAQAYGIASAIADGNDVFDVYEKAKAAVKYVREGNGPFLLEAKTYRVMGHYVGDPGVYRSKEEVSEWKENRDPLALFRDRLLSENPALASELDIIREEVSKQIKEAVEFARSTPPLDPESALSDVYADSIVE